MDDYQGEKNIKKESEGDDVRLNDASSILDVSQTIQHLLAMSSIASGGAILSPMQLLQASGSSGAGGASQLSIPWSMLPHHYQQMMVLQQGLGQPFLMSDVVDDKDGGHVIVVPTGGDQTNQYNNVSAVSNPAVATSAGMSGRVMNTFGGGQQNQSVIDSNGRLLNYHVQSSQGKAAMKEELGVAQLMARNSSMNAASSAAAARGTSSAGRHHGHNAASDPMKMPRPRPPKKPLTPYMMFSKEMWHQVKAANSHLSLVTEIGAIIGSMWRELDPSKKEHYNELFSRDKIRYDEEIRLYLKNNNLHPSDLIRARLSKKKEPKVTNQHRTTQAASHSSPAAILNPPGQQLVQSLLGYPVVDGSHAALVGLDGQLSNNLMQAWAGQPIQQILAQMGLTVGQFTHGDETNGEDAGAAIQTHPMNLYSNANACGSSDLQTTMTRSMNNSSVNDYGNAESGIDATCKSKSWPWSGGGSVVGHRQNQDDASAMQANAAIMYTVSAATERDRQDLQSTGGDNQLLGGHSGEWTQMKLASDGGGGASEQVRMLETRVVCLENALSEKEKEINRLTAELEKARHVIAQFRLPTAENEAADRNGGGGGVDHDISRQ